jgi:peptide/nickel transport system substrate-binding protein
MARAGSTGRRTVAALAAITIAMALVVSCSSGGETGTQGAGGTVPMTEGPPVDGGALVVGIPSESAGWNPISDRLGTAPVLAGSAIFEPLAVLNTDGEAEPWLATGWESNPELTSWTVTLRDGVAFHNGEAFDADAVKQNIDAYVASPLSGLVLKTLIAETSVVDDQTVEIDLLAPWASFPSAYLASQTSLQMAPESLAEDFDASNNPIGTGPFEFESWVPNTSLQLVKNDDYWREGEPHLDSLEFRPVIDDLSRTSSLQSGTLDMMMTVSASDAASLEGDYNVIRDWDSETLLLLVNTRPTADGQPNPMANIHARRAIAHATDAQAIADLIGDGVEVPVSPFSESSPWGDPSVGEGYPSFDVAKAEDEVGQYKADTGEDELRVSLIGPTDQATLSVFQTLQQQWAEAGIVTDIETFDPAALQMRPIGGKFQLSYGPIYSSPEPDQNYTFWSAATAKPDGEFSLNFTGFTTDESEALLQEARTTTDKEARRAAYTKFVRLLNEEAVNIWLYFTPYSIVASDRVHGLQGASEQPFANFWPKTWWGEVWVTE